MIARLARYAAVTVLVLLLAVFAAALWVTRTTAGARWAVDTAAGYVPGVLEADRVDGSIAAGLELRDARYASEAVDVTVRRLRLAVDPVLFPQLRLNVRELVIDGALVRLAETGEPEPPEEPGPPILERLALPFELNLDRLAVTDVTVTGGDGARLAQVDSAGLSGRWAEDIALRRLRVATPDGSVEGSLRLGLSPPHAVEAALALAAQVEIDEGAVQRVRLRLDADGSLEDLRLELDAAEPRFRLTGFLRQLMDTPAWDLELSLPYLQWPLAVPAPQAYLRGVTLESRGSMDDYTVSGDGAVAAAEAGEHAFAVALEGNASGARIARHSLDGTMLAAGAEGRVRWAEPRAVEAVLDLARFDPSRLGDFWPADAPVGGEVAGAWRPGSVELEMLRLEVAGTGSALTGSGIVDLEAGVVDADLEWRELRWPLAPADGPALASEFGRVRVGGQPDDWTFDGRIAFAAGELPQGVFQLAGNGTRDGVRATLAESRVLGGRVSGEAAYDWRAGTWAADLETEELALDPLLPRWPGQVSGRVRTEGRVSPLRVQAHFTELDGRVRGRRVNGTGGFEYAPGVLRADNLQLAAGESWLRADGELWGPSGLSFELAIDALAAYVPDLGGSVRGGGNLALGDAFPRLRLDLEAEDLRVRDVRLERLSLDSAGAPGAAPVALTARGEGLAAGDRSLAGFTLVLAAAEDRQRLEADLRPGEGRLALAMAGAFDDWRSPLDGWTGELSSLVMEAGEDDTRFALDGPAELTLARDGVRLAGACLAGAEGARLCLEGGWSGVARVDASMEIEEVPVNLVRLYRDTGIVFTQKLSGRIAYEQDGGSRSGEADIAVSAGEAINRLDERLSTRTGAGNIRVALAESGLLTGTLTLPLEGSSEIGGALEIDDLGRGAASPFAGELRARVDDVGMIAEIVPVLDHAAGRLDLALDLDGILGDPDFAGRASLAGGEVVYAPLGLALANIELEARADEVEGLDLRGTFTAGEGRAELRGLAVAGDGPGTGIGVALNGENLTVVDLPDINVIADMDLALGYRDRRLTMNGGVLVPRARISPTSLGSARVSESGDVVVVGGEAPETEDEAGEGAPPFRIVGTVGVQLGEDVIVDLDVAEARLTGTAAYTWNGPAMPIANGQYSISGRFEAYGQVLDIAEGSIRFPGVPASNPQLRIRAEREIFGNAQIRSAGVLVTGTARNPEIEVYTNPATTEERALTLLVTGSDFDYEQGVGAVDVGTYIAPDLYISYGIGLFERDNVISLRYDLGRGFGIKATSGRRAEGVDLSYTIER